MKKARFLACLLIVCLCATVFCSCAKKDVLTIKSGYFTELEAKEVDINWLRNLSNEDGYRGPIVQLTTYRGELHLKPYSLDRETSMILLDNGFYLYGLDLGEFDGWVSICQDYRSQLEGYEGERLLTLNCVGFLEPSRETEAFGETHIVPDGKIAYAFVYDYSRILAESKGYIYKLTIIDGEKYTFEKFVELDSEPKAFLIDADNNIIVATATSLNKVDPEGNVTQLFTADYWPYLQSRSVLEYEGAYYISTMSGILKYTIDTQEVVWYPYYNTDEE